MRVCVARAAMVIATIIVLMAAGCGRAAWREFSSARHGFAMQVPGPVEEKRETMGQVPATQYGTWVGGVKLHLGVTVYEFPPGALPGDGSGFLEKAARRMLLDLPESEKVRRFDTQPARVAGRSGLAVVIEGTSGSHVEGRLVCEGDRIYEVDASTHHLEEHRAAIDRFLGSFRLTATAR